MRRNGAEKFRLALTRIFTAVFGICSIAWAFSLLPIYREAATLASIARHVLSQDRYNSQQLNALNLELNAAPISSLPRSSLIDVAVIRLRLTEANVGKNTYDADVDRLQTSVTAALAANPTSSFLWLIEYWIQNIRDGSPRSALEFLRMSYILGPNEGWVMVRRSPRVLSVYAALPSDLEARAVHEFTRLIQSHLYGEAADILARAAWPIREKLMEQLVHVAESDRRWFAKELESKNLRTVVVPGVNERHNQSF